MKIEGLLEAPLGMFHLGVSYWILRMSQSLASQADRLAPEVIPMADSYFRSGQGYTQPEAETARQIVHTICQDIGFWSAMSTVMIVYPCVAVISGAFRAKRISFFHATNCCLIFAGASFNFLALGYFLAALIDLPFLKFESY